MSVSDLNPDSLRARLDAVGGEVTVTTADVLKGGFCITGLVRWIEDKGFDRSKALREGLSGAAILEMNDAYGNRALHVALMKVEGNGDRRR